jgi:hypothetical protein
MVELFQHSSAGTIPMARMALAYGALLRYAGVKVTDDEVYHWIVSDPAELAHVAECLNVVLELMIPPSMRGATGEPARPIPAVVKSSRKRTKR